MPFRAESLDFISNLDTLWAVVAGAVLATAGGFAATQLEHRIDTRRKEREAALFFGELMSMVRVTAESAKRAKGIGDPYGPVTMRLLRLVRRELDVYDRNRERLFEIRDPTMRAHIHTVLLRATMGVEGTIESAEDCIEIATDIASNPEMPTARREVLEKKLAEQSQRRDLSFEFLDEMSDQAVGLAHKLEPIARVNFDAMIQATKDV